MNTSAQTLTPQQAYDRLQALFGEYHVRDDAVRECYIPDIETGKSASDDESSVKYAEFRAVLDAPGTSELLDRAEQGDWPERDRRNLQLMRYLHDIHVVEREVGQEYGDQVKRMFGLWKPGATNDDWQDILPDFRQFVRLARDRAERLGAQMGCSPYEALLREHDPDMTEKKFDAWMGDIKLYAQNTLRKARRVTPPDMPQFELVPVENQMPVMTQLLADMGFDLDPVRGYCRGGKAPNTNSAFGRTLIQLPLREEDVLHAPLAAVHELGHGLHEQDANSRPTGEQGSVQPVDRIINNMSLQEGHALLFEYMLGHNAAFAEHLAGRLCAAYGDDGITAEALMERMRRVRPGPLRRGSDPASYALHVVMRCEIERDLINGDLKPDDRPKRWKRDMSHYFGAQAADNIDGPGTGWMQDRQMFTGFGYWPSYAIGMCNAAIMYTSMQHDIPDLDNHLRRGEFGVVNDWLRENVYAHGQQLPGHELMRGLMQQHGMTERDYTAPLLDIMQERLRSGESQRGNSWSTRQTPRLRGSAYIV